MSLPGGSSHIPGDGLLWTVPAMEPGAAGHQAPQLNTDPIHADPEAWEHRVLLTRHSSGSAKGGMSTSRFVETQQGHPGTRVVIPAHRLGVQEVGEGRRASLGASRAATYPHLAVPGALGPQQGRQRGQNWVSVSGGCLCSTLYPSLAPLTLLLLELVLTHEDRGHELPHGWLDGDVELACVGAGETGSETSTCPEYVPSPCPASYPCPRQG